MNSYQPRAHWGGSSTLAAPSSSSAYSHLTTGAPRYANDAYSVHSPASSAYSMDSSPSPQSSNYPSTPVTPTWNSPTAGSPRIYNHGSPLLGSPPVREEFYREFDLTNSTHSLSSTFSSVLCPRYSSPPCPPVHQLTAIRPEPRFLSGRRGPVVPQRSYSSHFGTKAPTKIDFQLEGASELGVPMRLLVGEFAPELPVVDRDGKVFSDDIPTTITLRIWWPGYEQWPRRVTMRKATGLLNRIEIAMQVAEAFRNFCEEGVPEKSNGHSAFYGSQWKVGKNGIDLRDLVLLSLYQVSKGSFQADIRLELDRQ